MHFPSPINLDWDYFGKINHQGIAEAYIRDIYKNVHEKKFSYLATITGRHRTGKSVTGLSFADLLDPTFEKDLEKRVVYTPQGFSGAIQDLVEEGIKGGVIVWDEANLGLSSRDWYTQANKHINFTVQAFGFMLPIVFFVTQDVTFIDKQPRKLFHSFMEVTRSNNKYNNIRPFQVSINKRSGAMYYSYPRMSKGRKSRGQIIKLKPIHLMKPPDRILLRYEKHSIKKKENLMKENDEMIKNMREKNKRANKKEKLTDDEIVEYCISQRNNPVYITKLGGYDVNTIYQEFGISFSKAKYLKSRADAKLILLKKEGIN